MNKKKLIKVGILIIMFTVIQSQLISQQKMYGAETVRGQASFTIKVMKNDHRRYCECINSFCKWLDFVFHEMCHGIKYPVSNEHDADCVLMKFGFDKGKINRFKRMNEFEQLAYLISEAYTKKCEWGNYTPNLINKIFGSTIVINGWNY